jgi:hypothetical protein
MLLLAFEAACGNACRVVINVDVDADGVLCSIAAVREENGVKVFNANI